MPALTSYYEEVNSLHNSGTEIRILVVDDHPIFRLGVCERIKAIGGRVNLVGEATDGLVAQKMADALRPDLILMDLNMPGISGIEATRNIKSAFKDIHIIVLSSDDEIGDVNAALQAGASGYLLKSVTGPELQEAIFAVMAGGSALSPTVARRLLTILTQPISTSVKLSEREVQILNLVSKGSTNKSIGKELFLSIRTVESHVHNIFQKLGVSSRTEAVTQAIRDKLIQTPSSRD